jgi:hypothetical protein
MILKALKTLTITGLITLFTQSAVYAENSDDAELDLTVKEDIAAAQVMIELCPALIGNKADLQRNIDQFTTANLKRLSNPNTTYSQLLNDADYQTAYKEAKLSTSEVDQSEQTSECENILNLGDELNQM